MYLNFVGQEFNQGTVKEKLHSTLVKSGKKDFTKDEYNRS